MQPPIQRPITTCHIRTGDIHVKWKVPERISAPSTASPITSAASGTISPKMPSAAMRREGDVARVVDQEGQQPEQHGAARTAPASRRAASGARTTAACTARSAPTPTVAAPTRGQPWARSSHELPEEAVERVVERAHLAQADSQLARQARHGDREISGSRRRHHDTVDVEADRGDPLVVHERRRRSSPIRRLISVDLPTFGRPTTQTRIARPLSSSVGRYAASRPSNTWSIRSSMPWRCAADSGTGSPSPKAWNSATADRPVPSLGLVDDDGDRLAAPAQDVGDEMVGGIEAALAVHEKQHVVGAVDRALGLLRHQLHDAARRFDQPAGVDDDEAPGLGHARNRTCGRA